MKEFIFENEYNEIIEEKKRFEDLYGTLIKYSKEEIFQVREDEEIKYLVTIYSDKRNFICFLNSEGEDLVTVLLSIQRNIFDFLKQDLIEFVEDANIEGKNDNYNYKTYRFKYLEEPEFISQIFNGYEFEKTDLIKQINDEIEYYKDKVIEDKKELYDYTETNDILSKYKFELEEE